MKTKTGIYYEVIPPTINDHSHKQDIVFLHGNGGDSNALQPLILEVHKEYPSSRIISYDLRGHGLSSKVFDPKSICPIIEHSKDLFEISRELKLNSPVFIGHCLGGMIIQEYLNQDFTIKPKKIVIINSTNSFPNLLIPRKLFFIVSKKLGVRRKLNEKESNFKRCVKQHLAFANSHDWNIFRIWHDIKNVGGIALFLFNFASFFGWKNKSLYKIDNENSCIIMGRKDCVLPLFLLKKQFSGLKKCKKIILESNHLTPLSNTKKLAEIIIEFCKL